MLVVCMCLCVCVCVYKCIYFLQGEDVNVFLRQHLLKLHLVVAGAFEKLVSPPPNLVFLPVFLLSVGKLVAPCGACPAAAVSGVRAVAHTRDRAVQPMRARVFALEGEKGRGEGKLCISQHPERPKAFDPLNLPHWCTGGVLEMACLEGEAGEFAVMGPKKKEGGGNKIHHRREGHLTCGGLWTSKLKPDCVLISTTTEKLTMLAPIQGTMKRKIIIDITAGFAIGGAMGAYWWTIHKNMVATRENYYAALAEKKKIEESA